MKIVTFLVMLFAATAMAEQNVVVVFDDSGSMSESMGNTTKIGAAKNGLYTVLKNLPADSNVGIVCLNAGWVMPIAKYEQGNVTRAVNQLRAGGGTPLGVSMKAGADALIEFRAKHKYGVYRLLIITDGEADDPNLVEKYNNDIRTRNIIVDVIGVKMSAEHQLATKVNSYRRADDSNSLNKAIQESLAESGTKSSDISNYDEIAAIPDDMAKAVVSTVVTLNNSPIGDPPARPVIDGQVFGPKEEVGVFGTIVFLTIVIVGIIVLVFIFTQNHNYRFS